MVYSSPTVTVTLYLLAQSTDRAEDCTPSGYTTSHRRVCTPTESMLDVLATRRTLSLLIFTSSRLVPLMVRSTVVS